LLRGMGKGPGSSDALVLSRKEHSRPECSVHAIGALAPTALLGDTFGRRADDYNGLPSASLFGPIYAMLRRAEHEAADRVRRGLKTCSKCRQERPLDEFNPDPRTRDGHRSECGPCQQQASREAYLRRRDRAASDEGRKPSQGL
jgi:hypothetical protein